MKRDKFDLIKSLGLFTLMVFLLAAMFSYSPYDIGFETSTPNLHIRNYTGIVGAHIAWFIFKAVGYAGFFVPFLCLVWGIGILAERFEQRIGVRILGLMLFFSSSASLFSLTGGEDSVLMVERGGLLGYLASSLLLKYIGVVGGYIVTFALSVLALLLVTEFLLVPLASFLVLRMWNLIKDLKVKRLEKKLVTEKILSLRPRPRLKPAVKVDKKQK